jgi:AcrR family transcriptional regulator
MGRREEIYETALRLFIEAGYDNTPISRIAKALGLTKAGLYHYFSSKEELLFLIHDYYLKKDFIPIIDAAEQLSDPQKRIAYFLKDYTKLLASDPSARVLIHEVKRLKPKHYRRITQVWRRAFNLVREGILDLQKSGRSEGINHTFATFAAIGMCSWTFYWFDYARQESIEELSDTLVHIFFKGLLKDRL